MNSKILNSFFKIQCLDISDKRGFSGIGQLNFHNIFQAISHYYKFIQVLFSCKPDVIYISIARGFWGFLRDSIFLITARIFRIPVVAHLRAGRFDIVHDSGWIGKFIAKTSLSGVVFGVVLANNLRSIFQKTIDESKIRVIPNGVDIEFGTNSVAVDSSQVTSTIFTVICLTNLFPDKGIHVVIQAAALLVKQGYFFQIIFVGDWLVPTYKNYCLNLIEEFNLQHNVVFAGVVTGRKKIDILHRADIVVFTPIKPEGMPWVVLEAMAASKPVIGTPQGAMTEMIQHEATGLLIQTDNPQELSEAISRFIENPQLKQLMGENARKKIEEHYSITVAHQKLCSVLQEALNGVEKK